MTAKIPLPPALEGFFIPSSAASRGLNRSLLFDRGLALHEGVGTRFSGGGRSSNGKTVKQLGLESFIERFDRRLCDTTDFASFLLRRTATLEALGSRVVDLRSATRLVAGLGLPHTSETGFLLDRLTGCPYLPGSSLKGLLRAAARQVVVGELPWPDRDRTTAPNGKDFLADNLDRLFGPELGGDTVAQKGDLVLYDAFPVVWPRLELDVLNPHGREDEIPADTRQPIPVYFLTVAPETTYRFFVSSRSRPESRASEDLDLAETLLRIALDDLGAGGKTSAGYGTFILPKPAAGTLGTLPGPSASPPVGTRETWEGVWVVWLPSSGKIEVKGPRKTASLSGKDQVAELRMRLWPSKRALKNNKPVRARVTVERRLDGGYEVGDIETDS